MTNENTEPAEVSALYDNLTPFRNDGETVWVMSTATGMRFPTVAVAHSGGDAGGQRMCSSQPVALLPGLNKVSAGFWARVESDADRQRKRIKGGGILSQMLDKELSRVDLGKTSASKAAEMLAATSNLEVIGELRSHPKHGVAAAHQFEVWHRGEASTETKVRRHFWAMYSDSRKVA
jgi:hypothetical protein